MTPRLLGYTCDMSNKPPAPGTKGVRVSRAVYDRVFSRLAHRQPFAAGLDDLLGELDGKARPIAGRQAIAAEIARLRAALSEVV